MKRVRVGIASMVMVILMVCIGFSAYHHEGEQDADKFLAAYPDMAGTKLDHCALCHSGGQYERRPGQFVSLGSCQWCHHTYGYDGSGNIIDTINDYGMDYLLNGRDQAAIEAIENLDSDGDGYTNIAEIEDNSFPGNPDDDPTKVIAPYRVYTKAQLEALTQHTQFLLLNTSRSGDFYAQYTGVPVENLLQDAGISDAATGITVYAPDGWSQYHPLEIDEDPELYHVNGTYPAASYQYDTQADTALNPVDGWCDYSAPSCQGRNHLDPIVNPNGNKMILAIKRDGAYMDAGILNEDNKLDGEGPYRVIPPQKTPSPPDQSSRADNQSVVWPYTYDWDHNAGAATRSVTIIKVEPLPPGTTDIDILEAGWDYVDDEKIIVYGALDSRVPLNIVSFESGLTDTGLGEAIDMTLSTTSTAGSYYCTYYTRPGYQNGSPGSWQLAKDWSGDNTLRWNPATASHYLVVGYVTDDAAFLTDDTFSNIFHQVGFTVDTSSASTNPIEIAGMTSDLVYPHTSGTAVTFTTAASGGNGTLYYQYWYRVGRGAWTMAKDYSDSAACTITPSGDGLYTVLVRVTDNPSGTSYSTAGMTCSIGN